VKLGKKSAKAVALYFKHRRAISFVMLLVMAGLVFAQGPATLYDKLNDLCKNIRNLVPLLGVISLVIGGAIYAGSQVLGAEARAKMNVWATALLTAGVLGIVVGMLAPAAMKFIIDAFGVTDIATDWCEGAASGG